MATAIRMRRGGRTHSPYYRIVVQDTLSRMRGPEIDTLGVYHPCARPEPITEVDVHKALEWLRKGAKPSDTAKSVFKKLGIMKHFHDGTTPEEAVAAVKDGEVEDKGYNAAPPVVEKAPVEEPAEAAEEAVEAEAPAADETSTPETEEDKAE
jgi:small subunit ribosomal protein S16